MLSFQVEIIEINETSNKNHMHLINLQSNRFLPFLQKRNWITTTLKKY